MRDRRQRRNPRPVTRCTLCGGRLTCPDRPPWVAVLCILSPLLLPVALIIYATIGPHC